MSLLSPNSKLHVVDSSHMYFWDESPIPVRGNEANSALKLYCSKNGGISFSLVQLSVGEQFQNDEDVETCRMMDIGFGGKNNELGCVLVQRNDEKSFLFVSVDNGLSWRTLEPDDRSSRREVKEEVEDDRRGETGQTDRIVRGRHEFSLPHSRDHETFDFDAGESELWHEDDDRKLRFFSQQSNLFASIGGERNKNGGKEWRGANRIVDVEEEDVYRERYEKAKAI
eukprot:243636-Hanusia_phi.AAC.2